MVFHSGLRHEDRSFWGSLKKIGNDIWNGIEGTTNFIWGAIKSVDSFLDNFENVPVLGEIANMIKTNPIYEGVVGVADAIHEGVEVIGRGGGLISFLEPGGPEPRLPPKIGVRPAIPGGGLGLAPPQEGEVPFRAPTRDFSSIAIR